MTDPLVLTEPDGMISVPPATLVQIVARAAERVDGVRVRRPRRAVEVALDGANATVSLRLAARYGTVLVELAEAVQHEVATALGQMCEVDVRRVDVSVEELVEA